MLKDTLRALRKAQNLTQQALALRAGVSQTTVADIERGRNESSKALHPIARALGVSVEQLVGVNPSSVFVNEPETTYGRLNAEEEKLLRVFRSLTSAQRRLAIESLDAQAAANQMVLDEFRSEPHPGQRPTGASNR